MKTKAILLALVCFTAGVLTAHPARITVTIAVESLLGRAAINRNLAEFFWFDDYSAGFFRGKAEAYEQLAQPYHLP